jgi:hypothetical protein
VGLATQLVRAPLRLGLSIAGSVLDAGLGVVRTATSPLRSEPPAPPREPAAGSPPARVSPSERPSARRRPARRQRADRPAAQPTPPVASSPAPPVASPTPPLENHVDEEVALAAEAAEAGAEEGAHAELHVEEPWDGYDRMRVSEITNELAGATRAALAAVELYESTHKGRRSVLETAERRLRELSGPGAAGNGDAPATGP